MDRVIGNYDFCACGTPIKRGQTLCDRCRRAGKELEEKVAGGMMDDKRQHTPPWETAEALREQLAARARDAKRIRRLHRWLRQQRTRRARCWHLLMMMEGSVALAEARIEVALKRQIDTWEETLQERIHDMEAETATSIAREVTAGSIDRWEHDSPPADRWLLESKVLAICRAHGAELGRPDGPYMGLSPSSAATQHHPLKEDDHGCRR